MRELRALHFDRDEIARALIAHRQKRGERLPRGTLEGVAVIAGPAASPGAPPKLTCRVTIRDDFGAGHDVEMREAEVAAALIEDCIARRVPVPRRARKTVEAMDDGVLLVFNLDRDGGGMTRPRVTARGAGR